MALGPAERYGLERQDGFAGFVHRFDFLLKLGRQTSRAELGRGVDYDRKSIAVLRLNPESIADKAGVAHIRAWDADSNYVVGHHDVEAGCKAQCNITETRHPVRECTITHSRVTVAASVVLQRMGSDGRVVAAFGVKKQRATTHRCVRVALGIESEHTNANCVLSLPTILLKSDRSPTAVLYERSV